MDAFTRRNFLIAAMTTALGSATVTLIGCAPTSPSAAISTAMGGPVDTPSLCGDSRRLFLVVLL